MASLTPAIGSISKPIAPSTSLSSRCAPVLTPNTSLVGAFTTDSKLGNATVGARFYLTDRFVLRADYSIYTAFLSDSRSSEYRAVTAGLSFFF